MGVGLDVRGAGGNRDLFENEINRVNRVRSLGIKL